MTTVGILHPGEMGAGIAGTLVRAGHKVLWVSAGRSDDTKARAEASELTDARSLTELLSQSEIVLSVSPPHAAISLAREVAGFGGIFVDANAISPNHADEIRSIIEGGGASYVDGGVIGSPPPGDATRLYLSGDLAETVASLFSTDEVATKVLVAGGSSASAMKMAYAAWTKGSAAMMLDIRAMAKATGVEDALVEEWSATSPNLIPLGQRAARQAQDRGWRWVGEMEEIAHTFRSANLPSGFHEGASEIFARVPRKLDAAIDEATLAEVIDLLLH